MKITVENYSRKFPSTDFRLRISDRTHAKCAGTVGSDDHPIVFQTSPAIFGTLIETGAGHNHALRLACSLIRFGFAERTIAHHTIVMRLIATSVLVVDFHNALGRDLTTGRAPER